jgi:HAD superfamily hydrolase (TIGR01509 family)
VAQTVVVDNPTSKPGPDQARALRGVLWDLDGTVVDSEPAWLAAETALVRRYGGAWSKAQAIELVGSDLRHTAAVLQRAGVELEPMELIATLIDFVAERVVATRPWRPGILSVLAECAQAGLACALVSMSWRRFTTAVADLVPGVFSVIVSGDEVTRGKPEPEAYLVAAARLGLEPADCIALEDSPTGVAAALNAGIATVAVPNPTVTAPEAAPGGPPERVWERVPEGAAGGVAAKVPEGAAGGVSGRALRAADLFGIAPDLDDSAVDLGEDQSYGGIAPAPGLTILRSTEDLTVRLLRQLHAANWVAALRTADTASETSTNRRAAP